MFDALFRLELAGLGRHVQITDLVPVRSIGGCEDTGLEDDDRTGRYRVQIKRGKMLRANGAEEDVSWALHSGKTSGMNLERSSLLVDGEGHGDAKFVDDNHYAKKFHSNLIVCVNSVVVLWILRPSIALLAVSRERGSRRNLFKIWGWHVCSASFVLVGLLSTLPKLRAKLHAWPLGFALCIADGYVGIPSVEEPPSSASLVHRHTFPYWVNHPATTPVAVRRLRMKFSAQTIFCNTKRDWPTRSERGSIMARAAITMIVPVIWLGCLISQLSSAPLPGFLAAPQPHTTSPSAKLKAVPSNTLRPCMAGTLMPRAAPAALRPFPILRHPIALRMQQGEGWGDEDPDLSITVNLVMLRSKAIPW